MYFSYPRALSRAFAFKAASCSGPKNPQGNFSDWCFNIAFLVSRLTLHWFSWPNATQFFKMRFSASWLNRQIEMKVKIRKSFSEKQICHKDCNEIFYLFDFFFLSNSFKFQIFRNSLSMVWTIYAICSMFLTCSPKLRTMLLEHAKSCTLHDQNVQSQARIQFNSEIKISTT